MEGIAEEDAPQNSSYQRTTGRFARPSTEPAPDGDTSRHAKSMPTSRETTSPHLFLSPSPVLAGQARVRLAGQATAAPSHVFLSFLPSFPRSPADVAARPPRPPPGPGVVGPAVQYLLSRVPCLALVPKERDRFPPAPPPPNRNYSLGPNPTAFTPLCI